jgi:mannonate dehydratase
MIITDLLKSEKDLSWDYAKQCGVEKVVIKLPESGFDVTDKGHWASLRQRYADYGFTPVIVEPMPNELHCHIKTGDNMRDASIEKVIKMFKIMDGLDVRTICFNWMAHIGWLRTSASETERGGALVTAFNIDDYRSSEQIISEAQLWSNYEYFIKAVIHDAEKHHITLALHPDDPPIAKLGGVSRIMISAANIERAIHMVESNNLGLTMCQATFAVMGEDLFKIVPRFAGKIKFIHFRNAVGNACKFRETFHDNGALQMGKLAQLYKSNGIDVPIRVDHVPTMAGENCLTPGYDNIGRLYAIGYLKGLLEATDLQRN